MSIMDEARKTWMKQECIQVDWMIDKIIGNIGIIEDDLRVGHKDISDAKLTISLISDVIDGSGLKPDQIRFVKDQIKKAVDTGNGSELGDLQYYLTVKGLEATVECQCGKLVKPLFPGSIEDKIMGFLKSVPVIYKYSAEELQGHLMNLGSDIPLDEILVALNKMYEAGQVVLDESKYRIGTMYISE